MRTAHLFFYQDPSFLFFLLVTLFSIAARFSPGSSLTQQPDSIPPSFLPCSKNLSVCLHFYTQKTHKKRCECQEMGLEPPCRYGAGAGRKEEKQLLAEGRGIFQGTPVPDLLHF